MSTSRASKTVPRQGDEPPTGKRESRHIVSQAIRDSARGEECTLQIVGVCNHDASTTVLAHLPDESHGIARKSDDISACYACSACHSMIDGRTLGDAWRVEPFKASYMRRAMVRTWRRLIEKGIVTIKGMK
jgi:hypothetical protein